MKKVLTTIGQVIIGLILVLGGGAASLWLIGFIAGHAWNLLKMGFEHAAI